MSTIANTVEMGLLALLFIAIASAPVLFSLGHVMAQRFPPAFPPGNNANNLRLQVVQRAGPSTTLGNGIGTSIALCHADEQVVGGGFVERRSASTSPTIDFRVLASFRAQPPTNGWTVRALGSDTSFAALAQCARIVMQ